MNVTLEQLAEKLNLTVWSKGELKRIYLNDAGYNTKKMSTKTFIFQDKNGDFKVSCKVECPSQPWQWCASQEDEVKNSVYQNIEGILEIMNLTLVNHIVLEEKQGVMVYVRKGEKEPMWYTEDMFYDTFGKYPREVWDEVPTIVLSLKDKIERGKEVLFHSGNILELIKEIKSTGIEDLVTIPLMHTQNGLKADFSGLFRLKKHDEISAFDKIREGLRKAKEYDENFYTSRLKPIEDFINE
jgi:hypothetical protein